MENKEGKTDNEDISISQVVGVINIAFRNGYDRGFNAAIVKRRRKRNNKTFKKIIKAYSNGK